MSDMPATLKYLRRIALPLLFAMLGGCGFLQPVTETVATTAVMQIPGSFEQLETRVHCLEHARPMLHLS